MVKGFMDYNIYLGNNVNKDLSGFFLICNFY